MGFFKPKYHLLNDEELAEKMNTGDHSAFNEIYSRYNKGLYFYFYRMMNGDNDKAKDLLQELFLKLIQKGHLFNGNGFKTWVYVVAGNLCRNKYREESRIYYLQSEEPESFHKEGFDAHDEKLFVKNLSVALNNLDEEQKQTFVLRYQEELSLSEIAQIMECPEGTVKSRIHYVLKKLSEKLKEFNYKTMIF